jgi:hypothetical protein
MSLVKIVFESTIALRNSPANLDDCYPVFALFQSEDKGDKDEMLQAEFLARGPVAAWLAAAAASSGLDGLRTSQDIGRPKDNAGYRTGCLHLEPLFSSEP